MKYAAPFMVLFSFACFFAPDGQGVWVTPSQVVGVVHNAGDECPKGSHSKIITATGIMCVRETPQEVTKRLDDVKEDK